MPTAKIAVLEGDPAKRGFFVMRIKLPAGTKAPAHVHDNIERVTVISGKINLAMETNPTTPAHCRQGAISPCRPKQSIMSG